MQFTMAFMASPMGSPIIARAFYAIPYGLYIDYLLYGLYGISYGLTSGMKGFLSYFPWALWHFQLFIIFHNNIALLVVLWFICMLFTMECILFPMGSCLIPIACMLCRMAYMVSMLLHEVFMAFPLVGFYLVSYGLHAMSYASLHGFYGICYGVYVM